MCAAADNGACRNATVKAQGAAALPLVGAYGAAIMPPGAPPTAQELECYRDIAKICAQNNRSTKYPPNQTECVQCADQHAGCTMQPLKPGSNVSHLVCPLSPDFPPHAGWLCPKACGIPYATYINNTDPNNVTRLHHNETECESAWFFALKTVFS